MYPVELVCFFPLRPVSAILQHNLTGIRNHARAERRATYLPKLLRIEPTLSFLKIGSATKNTLRDFSQHGTRTWLRVNLVTHFQNLIADIPRIMHQPLHPPSHRFTSDLFCRRA